MQDGKGNGAGLIGAYPVLQVSFYHFPTRFAIDPHLFANKQLGIGAAFFGHPPGFHPIVLATNPHVSTSSLDGEILDSPA
jgi:hypothetical protein